MSGRSSGVEHNLAKVGVESSNLFARSRISKTLATFRPSGQPSGLPLGLPQPEKRSAEFGRCAEHRKMIAYLGNIDNEQASIAVECLGVI